MLKRFICVSLTFLVVLSAPCSATQEDPFPHGVPRPNPVRMMQALPRVNLDISQEALRSYVMLEKYMRGVCSEEISSQDLLDTVISHGDRNYDRVRALASSEEVEDLRERLQSAHKARDPDIALAVYSVTHPRFFFAKQQTGLRPEFADPAAYALGFAHRTLALFLADVVDEGLFPGEKKRADRQAFAPDPQHRLWIGYGGP
ncbi:MAG: hypothetical protein C0514_00410 [Candidatus Puniceispirillum sp.]|nr:hypothetical protein [Candidatus Puniceispirillum sp.]